MQKNKIILIALLLMLIPVLLKPWTYPSDDAFFYLKIAQNIVEYGKSTFNNMTLTNGYHPLWMLVLLIPAKIFSFDNNIFLISVILIQILFALISINYIYKILAGDIDKKYLSITIPLLFLYLIPIGTLGSELHLNIMLQIFFIYYYWNEGTKNYYLLGFLLGLIFLSRLDNIFFILVFFSYLIYSNDKKEWLGIISKIAITFLIVATPYIFSNLYYFGALVPISGKIKSTFPNPMFNISALGSFGTIILFSNLCILIIAFAKRKYSNFKLHIILSIICVFHAMYIVMFTNHDTFWSWYYSTGFLNLLFFFPHLIKQLEDRIRVKSLTMIALIAIFTFGTLRTWSEYFNPDAMGFNPVQFKSENKCSWNIEIAKYLNNKFEKGTPIIAHDWPGIIAFYTHCNILALDGLTNDYKFQDKLSTEGLQYYTEKFNIRYMLAPNIKMEKMKLGWNIRIENENKYLDLYSILYKKEAGTISLDEKNRVVRFNDVLECSQALEDISLWEIVFVE